MLLAVIAIAGIPGSGADASSVAAVANTRPAPDKCRSARLAVAYYRTLTWTRQSSWSDRRATRTPIARRRSCHWARYAVDVWVARALSARKRAAYHLDWRSWLPANWVRLAICETSLNFAHTNGSFTSAFGISWAEYDADAAYNGAPPWRVRHTPRDQYNAARGHLARFGDGWTCAGP